MTADPAPVPSDLDRALSVEGVCLGLEPVGEGAVELRIACDPIAQKVAPGEFCQLRVGPGPTPLLRRPFSVCRADPEAGTLSFYLGIVGEGTARLAALRRGDRLGVLGPLGRGFTVPPAPSVLLMVAGGLGAAPFPLLAAACQRRGVELIWLNGAATAPRLFPVERLQVPVAAHLVTEDGSQGERGRVTDRLGPLLAGVDRVAACGPNPMLAAVAAAVAALAPTLPLEVSLEAPMGCGFGVCLGCAIPVRTPSGPALQLCCRVGPVLAAETVDWPRLLALPPAHAA
ncbi:MAG TPA: dihydroorotate dehydrogenase electron transfer subunit [Verrucomicrobiae bacterium]|nr:dihydroorotate dehydrogenase electron transfer subunit [Verrucomicrobiae bacterium]